MENYLTEKKIFSINIDGLRTGLGFLGEKTPTVQHTLISYLVGKWVGCPPALIEEVTMQTIREYFVDVSNDPFLIEVNSFLMQYLNVYLEIGQQVSSFTNSNDIKRYWISNNCLFMEMR